MTTNDIKNKNVGVFFGSRSAEHDISIITAQLIISSLKEANINVIPVYINKKGEWLISEKLGQLKAFAKENDLSNKESFKKYVLDLEKSVGKIVFAQKGLRKKEVTVDIAFPAFHGTFGEDGKIQGLFEMLSVPYVGCDPASSAISMDKTLTKQICKERGLPITPFYSFSKEEWAKNKEIITEEIKKLKKPYFIKPAHLGSSIGISKVKEEKSLEKKIDLAMYYDNKVLVEEAVPNMSDLTCAVLGNNEVETSLVQESKFTTDFFDFENKYITDGGKQFGNSQKEQKALIIPAKINKDITEAIKKTAEQVFKDLGCSGTARIDFLLDRETNEFYVNEVNPLPGTLYHHLWKKSGIETNTLIAKLLKLALEKHQENKQIEYTFSSSVIENMSSNKPRGGKKV